MPSEHKPHSERPDLEAMGLYAGRKLRDGDSYHAADLLIALAWIERLEEQLETLENACEQALMLLSRKRFDDDPEAKVMRAVLSTALGDSNPATEASERDSHRTEGPGGNTLGRAPLGTEQANMGSRSEASDPAREPS